MDDRFLDRRTWGSASSTPAPQFGQLTDFRLFEMQQVAWSTPSFVLEYLDTCSFVPIYSLAWIASLSMSLRSCVWMKQNFRYTCGVPLVQKVFFKILTESVFLFLNLRIKMRLFDVELMYIYMFRLCWIEFFIVLLHRRQHSLNQCTAILYWLPPAP